MAAQPQSRPDSVLTAALDAAKFYGGLVSGGVPPAQAVQITGQYVQARTLAELSGECPPRREPWERE